MKLEEFERKMNLVVSQIGRGGLCLSIDTHINRKACADFNKIMEPSTAKNTKYNGRFTMFWGRNVNSTPTMARHTRHELLLMWEQHVLANETYKRF